MKKNIDKSLDVAWSLLVKHRAGWRCEYCGKRDTLNSHHIYSRSKRSTRWDETNGICLCVAHHTFSSTFSAHKTPLEFLEWLLEYKGVDYINDLKIRANRTLKLMKHEKQDLLTELQFKIEQYESKR